MKLSRIPILRETIEVREDISFDVRGINLSDLMTLMHTHAPIGMILWRKLNEDDSELRKEDVRKVFSEVAYEFPDLVAAVIALASDEYSEDARTIARQLPIDVQTEAIESIFRLSFQSESTLEKLASLATKAIQGATRAMQNAQIPSNNGSGDSVAA